VTNSVRSKARSPNQPRTRSLAAGVRLMPTRLCAEPGCPHPAHYRGRCPAHARTTNRTTHHNRTIYNSRRWQLLRRRVLFEQPICATCDDAIATDVDHITAIEAGGDPWSRANLQGLCHACHSIKTRAEQHA
jgi:5-methylcytosine-specific restriction protein A